MPSTIHASRYKDQAAVSLETDVMSAQFLPSIGAKMCSLVYRPRNLELLIQRPGSEYLLQPYDGDYVAGECSGFDDMFPTIDECHYERYPWKGTRMPDHGEVWSIPWEHSVEGDRLYLSAYGVRLPYKLEKWAHFTAGNILRIDYRLTNLSSFDLDFLWAAHTMFILEEGAELVLPEGVDGVIAAFSMGGMMGSYGAEFAWPLVQLADGTTRDLRHMRPKDTREADKYYVKDRMPEGWCAVRYPQSDLTLALSFPVQQVPYLGILTNEGGWDDLYNIFLEPCSAPFDRPDVARLRKSLSTIGPRSTREWHVALMVAQGTTFRPVDYDGTLVSQGIS